MLEKKESAYIERARALLSSVEGIIQSPDEREKICQELVFLLAKEADTILDSFQNTEAMHLINLCRSENGKALVTSIVDQCYREGSTERRIDQLIFILFQYGIPKELPWSYRFLFHLIKLFGSIFPKFLGKNFDQMITQTLKKSIPIIDSRFMKKLFDEKRKEKILTNYAHLEKSFFSEEEAINYLHRIFQDLSNPDISYLSIKISNLLYASNVLSLYAQKNVIKERLKEIYRLALKFQNEHQKKMVMLDMGPYHFFSLTTELFIEILSDPEFFSLQAGITLQSYLPESYKVLKNLINFAKERVKNGGSPIKITLVKGGYFNKEKIVSAKKGWPQACFQSKVQIDANFKKMLHLCLNRENLSAAHLGIATHNLFDISYALCLLSEFQIKNFIDFEFLEFRLLHIQQAVEKILPSQPLIYIPLTKSSEKETLSSYVIRKIDDINSETFIGAAYLLLKDKTVWQEQESLFIQSCQEIERLDISPRRTQDRNQIEFIINDDHFEMEPSTDFSLAPNRKWAQAIISKWKELKINSIPLVINGHEKISSLLNEDFDPSRFNHPAYQFSLAKWEEIDEALLSAKKAQKDWMNLSFQKREDFFFRASQLFREKRSDLIGALMLDAGKILFDADIEISNSIEAIEYYLSRSKKFSQLDDIEIIPKGTVLVIPSRAFPCFTCISSIAAALIAGNAVLLQPPSEVVLIAYEVAKILWEAGIPKDLLQFVPVSSDFPMGLLLQDERLDLITTKCSSSQFFDLIKLHPKPSLEATFSGKNAFVFSSLIDREQAIRDLLESSFSHAGQKILSTSIGIIEDETLEDLLFQKKLIDQSLSFKVGSVWDLATEIPPLILPLNQEMEENLLKLESNQNWLLKPEKDKTNPNLWSPGILISSNIDSVKAPRFFPILSIIESTSFKESLQIAQKISSKFSSGLESLDPREHQIFMKKINSGNLFINQKISDSLIRKTPVGGNTLSVFGNGYKEGGPNFILNFINLKQLSLPQEKLPLTETVNNLTSLIEKIQLSAEELGTWYGSISNYAFWWNRLRHRKDPTKLFGQDNFFGYEPIKNIYLRIQENDNPLDVLRTCAAALTCGANLTLSWDKNNNFPINWNTLSNLLSTIEESEEMFIEKIKSHSILRLRMLSKPNENLAKAAIESGCFIIIAPPLANGRLELLKFLQEVSISIDYHRYGNLGARECELRKPIL